MRRLGAGGMGTVYLGRAGRRDAAVKVVNPGLAENPDFRARFRREVEICRRVTGTQVAELYDADTEAAAPWLAVRYVEGPTLDQAIRTHGPFEGRALIGFALAAAEALRQVHAAGVVHRDLKPSNVILTATTPVIIDFGIAAAADATALTATGISMGTAGWMAPEQILGGDTGVAADVFAWGAVVAYASTGRPPYGTGRPEALGYRVVHGSPDTDGVAEPLGPLVRQALSVDPLERPTVDELVAELSGDPTKTRVAAAIAETWVSEDTTRVATLGVETVVDRPGPIAHPRRARRRAAALAALAVLLGLAIAAGVLSQRSDEAPAAVAETSLTTTGMETTTSPLPSSTVTTVAPTTTTTTTSTSPPPPTTAPTTTTTVPPPTSPALDPELEAIFDAVASEVASDLGTTALSRSCGEVQWPDYPYAYECQIVIDDDWTPLVLVSLSPTGNYSWEYTSYGE